jgi:uncharacterized protein (DUF1810 family)
MTASDDPTGEDRYALSRFVEAQAGGVHERALGELRAGRKRSHWMWYVFPQLAGLGSSPMADRYGITGREEASAYLAHPVLGPRLVECAEALLQLEDRTAAQVMGHPDDLKLRSSATLFAQLSSPGSVFERLLEKYYAAEADERTLERLGVGQRRPG